MSFNTPWVNSYHSLMTLSMDKTSGKLSGTYSSTTGGSGTYDVLGWASLQDPTSEMGQAMAISILWRSNDNGKSDPSHEVSGMAGQVILNQDQQNLSLVHLFVETDPVGSGLIEGIYPDKLIFTPYTAASSLPAYKREVDTANAASEDQISGTWKSARESTIAAISFSLPNSADSYVEGSITYTDGSNYPAMGFTDIYAAPKLNLQGFTVSSYLDINNKRSCISLVGYIDLITMKLILTSIKASGTDVKANYTQVIMEGLEFEK